MFFTRHNRRRLTSIAARKTPAQVACEALEPRQLLTTFQIPIDTICVPDTGPLAPPRASDIIASSNPEITEISSSTNGNSPTIDGTVDEGSECEMTESDDGNVFDQKDTAGPIQSQTAGAFGPVPPTPGLQENQLPIFTEIVEGTQRQDKNRDVKPLQCEFRMEIDGLNDKAADNEEFRFRTKTAAVYRGEKKLGDLQPTEVEVGEIKVHIGTQDLSVWEGWTADTGLFSGPVENSQTDGYVNFFELFGEQSQDEYGCFSYD